MTCSPPCPSRLVVSNTCSSVSRPRRVTGERDITDRYRQLHQVARPVTSAGPAAAPGSPTAGLDSPTAELDSPTAQPDSPTAQPGGPTAPRPPTPRTPATHASVAPPITRSILGLHSQSYSLKTLPGNWPPGSPVASSLRAPSQPCHLPQSPRTPGQPSLSVVIILSMRRWRVSGVFASSTEVTHRDLWL